MKMNEQLFTALNMANIELINLKTIIDMAKNGALNSGAHSDKTHSVLGHVSSSLNTIKGHLEYAEKVARHD